MRKIVTVILVLVVLFILLLIPKTKENETVPDKENNVASINDNSTKQQNIILPGFVELDINNPGKLLCNLNEDFYLQFNIILKDTDELIYSSGLVEYGGYINTIELNKELQKGEYDAIVFIQPYDMTMNKTNSAQLSVKIKL